MDGRVAIIGAGSLVGQMLRRAWAGRACLWLTRAEWQASAGAAALAPLIDEAEAVVCLAGVTAGPSDFGINAQIGAAVAEAAAGRRLLLASTQAVYGPSPGPHAEEGPATPSTPYGRSKLEMEQAVSGGEGVTCLRLGNVVGADLLGRNVAAGKSLTLHAFADGHTPRRSYIDPASLAEALDGLLGAAGPLPGVLNVARAPTLEMRALLEAFGAAYETQSAPQGAVPEVSMDCARLFALLPGLAAPVTAAEAVDRWRRLAP